MPYTTINWENLPSVQTPINAENLNHMDEGIADANDKVDSVNSILHTVAFGSDPTILSVGDLDTKKDLGYFLIPENSSVTNCPVSKPCVVVISKQGADGTVRQTVFGDLMISPEIHTRILTKRSGSLLPACGPWFHIANSTDVSDILDGISITRLDTDIKTYINGLTAGFSEKIMYNAASDAEDVGAPSSTKLCLYICNKLEKNTILVIAIGVDFANNDLEFWTMTKNSGTWSSWKSLSQGDSVELVDNLDEVNPGKALDAHQGSVIKGLIEGHTTSLNKLTGLFNYTVANNLTTASSESKVLHAYQGKVLQDKITNLTTSLTALSNKIDSLIIKAGDTVTFTGFVEGTLSNGYKNIYFTLPTKKIITASNVTCDTRTSLSIRQNNKYLGGTTATTPVTWPSAIKVESVSINNLGINVNLSKSNGFGGINNDPVAIYIKFTLKFS